MRFSKIKYNGVKVELSWTTQKPGGSEEVEHHLRSFDPPHADFVDGLAAFRPIVAALLEVSEEWMDEARVVGLSINKEEDDRCGLVVTCLRKLTDANSPLVVNTPHLRQRVDEDGPGYLPDEMLDALEAMQAHAGEYLEGKRAQGDLFSKAS